MGNEKESIVFQQEPRVKSVGRKKYFSLLTIALIKPLYKKQIALSGEINIIYFPLPFVNSISPLFTAKKSVLKMSTDPRRNKLSVLNCHKTAFYFATLEHFQTLVDFFKRNGGKQRIELTGFEYVVNTCNVGGESAY